MVSILIRNLEENEVGKIRQIDRAEDIPAHYEYRAGNLSIVSEREIVTHFDQQELENIIDRQVELIKAGGCVIGAFHNDMLVGVASVDCRRRGSKLNYCKMDILYTHKAFRGIKVGQRLLAASKEAGKLFGAEFLYISATPTKHTVDFYLQNGARLTTELDDVLYEIEPQDIHLELSVH